MPQPTPSIDEVAREGMSVLAAHGEEGFSLWLDQTLFATDHLAYQNGYQDGHQDGRVEGFGEASDFQ